MIQFMRVGADKTPLTCARHCYVRFASFTAVEETRCLSFREDSLKRSQDAVMKSKCEKSRLNAVYFMMDEMTLTC